MENNARHRDRGVSEFIPKIALPPCGRCHFFPVIVESDRWVRRLNRRIAKQEGDPRRQKLERLRQALSGSGSITTYVHAKKEDFSLPMLIALVPGVTAANWTSVRDYIFYGSPTPPTPGLASLSYHIADYFCSRKTMVLVVTPIISDLRLEYREALAAGQPLKAKWVRLRGYWSLLKVLASQNLTEIVKGALRSI